MKKRNLDPRNTEQLYKDLHSYTKLPKKQQMVEYTSIWKEDGINFLVQLHPDAPSMPRFSHAPNTTYVVLGRSSYSLDYGELIGITIYSNHLDTVTIHGSHTPYDKTCCHEHTSTEHGRKRIEYKDMPKEHIDLYNKVMKIYTEHDYFKSVIINAYNVHGMYSFKENSDKLNTLKRYYFDTDVHWTYKWYDFYNHEHVVDWDEEKQAYLYWWSHSDDDGDQKVYFKNLIDAFKYIGKELYDDIFENWWDYLNKSTDAQFISIQ